VIVPSPILELRVALTTDEYDRLVAFYQEALGLDIAQDWSSDQGRVLMFELGRGTLEIFDERQAAMVDRLEVGQRVSGPIRFALQVPDVHAAVKRAVEWGATLVHEPVLTPWGDYNARLLSPDGLQITLFQVSGSE
jgi:methylmalonyl-CoA/ethylmalonyl-CoA epimerase